MNLLKDELERGCEVMRVWGGAAVDNVVDRCVIRQRKVHADCATHRIRRIGERAFDADREGFEITRVVDFDRTARCNDPDYQGYLSHD